MGSVERDTIEAYSVPQETKQVLERHILANEKIARYMPKGTADFASKIEFVGNDAPSIPINWRFAESAAALKGLEACLVAQLVKRKYGVEVEKAKINTDHAQLFFMSAIVWSELEDNGNVRVGAHQMSEKMKKAIPEYDIHDMNGTLLKRAATNIYSAKDGRHFHVHGSMDPRPTLKMLGLSEADDAKTWQEVIGKIGSRVAQIDSQELQRLASDVYKQAGVICETTESFRQSEHGKANAHVALFEIHDAPNAHQEPSWWPDIPQTKAERPLAGLKVVDLTRVIAAPAVTRGLAELGASVMRVTSPNLVDMSTLHVDLNWGKWNCSCDLKTEEGRQRLADLIRDADVVVQGYRPDVLDKYGFGQRDIIDLVKDRKRGIISARENCYGWNGPFYYRSGWQQVSDSSTGISASYGKAMGLENDESVTPVFPNSDYMTGIAGTCAILTALMKRAEHGGSYKVDLALNYYNQWLADSCGEYPEDVWQAVWKKNGKRVFRCTDNMGVTIPAYMEMIQKNSKDVILNPAFFEPVRSKATDLNIIKVKPIVDYGGQVKPGFNVGTRGNGKDAPKWPADLMIEVVT